MMKNVWNAPELIDLNVASTEYTPQGGSVQDGTWVSIDETVKIPTYEPGQS